MASIRASPVGYESSALDIGYHHDQWVRNAYPTVFWTKVAIPKYAATCPHY